MATETNNVTNNAKNESVKLKEEVKKLTNENNLLTERNKNLEKNMETLRTQFESLNELNNAKINKLSEHLGKALSLIENFKIGLENTIGSYSTVYDYLVKDINK